MSIDVRMSPDPAYRLPSLQILADELDEFNRTGRHVHLLHAVRALDEARGELKEFIQHQIPAQIPAQTRGVRSPERHDER
jgi:hypothetical protein